MTIQRVSVKVNAIDWAFKTTDLTEEQCESVAKKTKWLQKKSSLYLQPTIKQLGGFAKQLHVPFGNLLLSSPPDTENIKLAFRTEKNAPAQVSLTVRDVIYEMKRKQAWFRDESGLADEKLTFIGSAANLDNAMTLRSVSNLLNLTHWSTARELYNDLRRQLANLGILNMQKGGAGLGTNRPLDVNEMRAFVLLDDYAPLIFINQRDSYTARIFSIIHEFVHLLHGSDEMLSGVDIDFAEERSINKVVATFLMPVNEFSALFSKYGLEHAAHYFNVSPEAASIHAQEIGLIKSIDEVILPAVKANLKKESSGNPYNNALSLNDRRYMDAIVLAQDRGSVQPTRAASLIGISYKMLDKTVKIFSEREASA